MSDRKLVLDEGCLDDWYVLHEEPYRRINGADIEGTAEEWRAIAAAIDAGEGVGFKRCAVNPYSDGHWDISSPRNSTNATVLTPSEAKALVVEIRRVLVPAETPVAAPRDPRCSCTREAGDSDCAAHPTCSECGADLAHQRVVAERDDLRREVAQLGADLDNMAARETAALVAERDALDVRIEMQAAIISDTEADRDTALARVAALEASASVAAPDSLGMIINDLTIKLNLAETREKQATEACTALTLENQRLRDALALQKHLDHDIDGVLEDAEEVDVENAQLTNRVAALEAEVARLTTRQQELLQTIRNLSASTPYPEEQRAASVLIAEVGTLRSALTAKDAEVARLRGLLGEACDIGLGGHGYEIGERARLHAIRKEAAGE